MILKLGQGLINLPVYLCLFFQDRWSQNVCDDGICFCFTLQVLFWLQNYGEEFLNKHTSIGKSLHKARALQKKHEEFEAIAQVSLENQS